MGRISARSGPRALWLGVVSLAALIPLAMAAPPTAERQVPGRSATGSIQAANPAAPSKQNFETSPMPVDWQLDQLRSMIQELQAEVAELRQQTMQHGSAGSNVAGRLAVLEQAVQVSAQKLRLNGPGGAMEIAANGVIRINANSKIELHGVNTEVHAARHRVHGIAQSNQVITDSVVAKTYTPGAGNVW